MIQTFYVPANPIGINSSATPLIARIDLDHPTQIIMLDLLNIQHALRLRHHHPRSLFSADLRIVITSHDYRMTIHAKISVKPPILPSSTTISLLMLTPKVFCLMQYIAPVSYLVLITTLLNSLFTPLSSILALNMPATSHNASSISTPMLSVLSCNLSMVESD